MKTIEEIEEEFNDTIIDRGIECGVGWANIVYEYLIEVRCLFEENNLDFSKFKLDLAKQKFGYLNIYDNSYKLNIEKNVYTSIDNFKNQSYAKARSTCEYCMNKGKIYKEGSASVICEEHASYKKMCAEFSVVPINWYYALRR